MSFAWVTLITTPTYLDGVLTLDYALRKVRSKYPLVVLYTESAGSDTIQTLKDGKSHLELVQVDRIDTGVDFKQDVRFNETWTKLQVFALYQYEKVVFVDCDTAVVRNMDELFDVPLNRTDRILAASHACVCNPYKKPSYPRSWVPENCAFSSENYKPIEPQSKDDEQLRHVYGPSCNTGLKLLNSGVMVIAPHRQTYEEIISVLNHCPDRIATYRFPDQDLLADLYSGRWVPLSYKYNALKTLRVIHSDLWKDSEVKCIHYILPPKPWKVTDRQSYHDDTGTFDFWYNLNDNRLTGM